MLFSAKKNMATTISVSLQPNALGAMGWFTLNRYIDGQRTAIAHSGSVRHSTFDFVFTADDLQSWGEGNELELDVLVTFFGATKTDVLVDVMQIDAGTSKHIPRLNLDPVPAGKAPDFRFEIDTPGVLLPSGSIQLNF